MNELREVRLLGFPLRLHQHAVEHHAELIREFQLLALDTQSDRDVPRRLVDLMAELTTAYAGASATPDAEREAALARGDETADLTYHVPESAGEACRRLDRMLDEADAFCRTDQLLTLAASDEAAAFRRWYLSEFAAQLAGAEPTPWSGAAIATPR